MDVPAIYPMKELFMKSLALVAILGSLAASASAQEFSRFSFSVGGGFSQPVGNTARNLDTGWNVAAGGGVNFTPYVGAMINLGYNSFGINSGTLSTLGFPDGGLHVFSATFDPIVHFNPHGHVDMYLTGGGGWYRREQEFTQPAFQGTVGFDPFFGFYPAVIPVTEVLSSYSVNKPGVDVGAGFAMGTKWHGKFFAEARYNRIIMGNNSHTDYIPVTFGFRW
jgi:Outer membrane protein beta-barrel domain